jgi:hypothetical protein
MKDPVSTGSPTERQLFERIASDLSGVPMQDVCGIGVNLVVNAIRQSVAKRGDAEALFNELFGRAKTVLLDVHYDSVTGNRRSVFPFTQVVQAPFHNENSVIFHGK